MNLNLSESVTRKLSNPNERYDDERIGSETILSLKDVGVSFYKKSRLSRKKEWVLDSISLNLQEGETLGVIGKNGAGKSTLLKLLAGVIAPNKGTLYRKAGVKTSLLALQVGFMPELTGRENAIMSCILLGLTRKAAVSKVESIFQFAEIEYAINQPVGTYSAGMRARLGFGIAMESNPEILLIDEVLGVGDKDFKVKSRNAIMQRIKSDRSVILVSHDMNTVKELCDRAVMIESGKTTSQGNVKDVINLYCSK